MEWLKNIIEELNDYAGLFSMLAVIVGCITIWVTVRIYRKKKEEEIQRLKDELEARESLHSAAFPTDFKDAITRETVIKNAIKRGTK